MVARRYLTTGLAIAFLGACNSAPDVEEVEDAVYGCAGEPYPTLAETRYVLPLEPGTTFETGLTNCSNSFHGPGHPDQYAFDFDVPVGTPFVAARAGTVARVVEGASSDGGGPDDVGNFVVVDHGDETFGLYYHSPRDGIDVVTGQTVEQGDVLGRTGRSGLAGYPHLHFIVVRGTPDYPYDGMPVSFRNVSPEHEILRTEHVYRALEP